MRRTPLKDLVIPYDDIVLLLAFLLVFFVLFINLSQPVNKVFDSHGKDTIYTIASKILKRMYVYTQSKLILKGFPQYSDAIYFGLFNSLKQYTITPTVITKIKSTPSFSSYFNSSVLTKYPSKFK